MTAVAVELLTRPPKTVGTPVALNFVGMAAYGGSMTTAWKYQPARKAVRHPGVSRARRG